MNRPYVYLPLLLCFIIGFTFTSEQKEDNDHENTSNSQTASTSSSTSTDHNSPTKPFLHKKTTTTLAGCLALDNDAESTSKTSSEDSVVDNKPYWFDFPSGH